MDNLIWVIVGDLPSAYITVENSPNPACALDSYIGAMEDWVEAVEQGRPVFDIIPVNAEPTLANAQRLKTRLSFLDEEILARCNGELGNPVECH